VGDELADIQNVFTRYHLDWQSFYLGYEYSVVDQFGVDGFPTLIVLDKDQVIRSISTEIDYQIIEELMTVDP
jgi:protein-disulfide isomerase-like protein with CxxC motif